MSYTKTTWNPGAAPGISADNLNNIELGIERTHARSMTEATRDALAGDDLFAGRVIYNTTTSRLEIYTGTVWQVYTLKTEHDAVFHATTGHKHTGGAGDAPNIAPADAGLGNVDNVKQAPETRQINSGDYLSGGGDLSENRTLDVDGNAIRTLTTELRREVVSSFPTTGLADGRTVLLTQADGGNDPGPYTYFNGEWL